MLDITWIVMAGIEHPIGKKHIVSISYAVSKNLV